METCQIKFDELIRSRAVIIACLQPGTVECYQCGGNCCESHVKTVDTKRFDFYRNPNKTAQVCVECFIIKTADEITQAAKKMDAPSRHYQLLDHLETQLDVIGGTAEELLKEIAAIKTALKAAHEIANAAPDDPAVV